MPEWIMELIKSKKFKAAFFGILALVCMALGDQITWVQVAEKGWPIIVAYLAAQGIADFGKSKVIEERRTKQLSAPVAKEGSTEA